MRVLGGVPLRLSDGPYPFDEPPDLDRLTSVADRMALLREHLKTLCRPWDKLAPAFLDAYFSAIASVIAASQIEIEAMAARTGGLFAPPDWSFAALRPLPQAHLGGGARAELAFWTGVRFVAIAFASGSSPTRQARDALARIEAAGGMVARIPARTRQDSAALLALLPPEFARFWDAVAVPASPFGPAALADF